MKKKQILSTILVTAMMSTMFAGCGQTREANVSDETTSTGGTVVVESNTTETTEEKSAYPDYLNLDGYFPIVKEGEEVTLNITIIGANTLSEDPMDRYFWQLVEQKMNINVEIEQINSAEAGSYINMLFASDELPDILITNSALTTGQLVTYGMTEGQLMDMSPYMTDATLMPRLNELYDMYPSLKASLTAPDGGMYSQVMIADFEESSSIYQRRAINGHALNDIGKDVPTTLDDFVDMLYLMKKNDDTFIPLDGAFKDGTDPSNIIMNALGYNTNADFSIFNVALRNGVIGIPAADREIYGEYVTLMKQFFNDGIIHRDFFTQTAEAVKLHVTEGNVGVWVGSIDPADYDSGVYQIVPALTSKYSEEPVVGHSQLYTVGKFVVSSKTKYPEVIARLCDYLYTQEGNTLYQYGPFTTQEHLMIDGYPGITLHEETRGLVYSEVESGKYKSSNEARYALYMGFEAAIGCNLDQVRWRQEAYEIEDIRRDYENWVIGENTKGSWWRAKIYDAYKPVTTDGIPVLYFDEATSLRISELKAVIAPHMETETLKFITGERSLDELDKYFDEIERLGYVELTGLYNEAYANFLNNL